MFSKSGILIFIFAEKNYSIYAHTMLIKTPLLHQSSGPCVFLSLFLSLSGYFFGAQRLSEFTFLPRLLRPSREGTLHFHPIKRAPDASVNRVSPVPGALLAFCINQGISASFLSSIFLTSKLFPYLFLYFSQLQTPSSRGNTWIQPGLDPGTYGLMGDKRYNIHIM